MPMANRMQHGRPSLVALASGVFRASVGSVPSPYYTSLTVEREMPTLSQNRQQALHVRRQGGLERHRLQASPDERT